VRPENYLPFVGGAIVWFLVMPQVAACRWRVEVLRVQMLYGFAHAKALWDTVRNRTAGWVPTGATKAPNPVAVTVMRSVRVMVLFNVVALGSGIVYVALGYGAAQVWPAAIYALLYMYIAVPLLFAPEVRSWRQILRPAQQARPAELTPDTVVEARPLAA
jgi:cellulose synthase (UDP-forming)